MLRLGSLGDVRSIYMDVWILFLGISFLSSQTCKNLAIGLIEDHQTNLRRHPERYIRPARWIRKLFKLEQHLIPRYLYFELIVSLVFALLGPINLIIFGVADCSPSVGGPLVMIHVCLIFINFIYLSIMWFVMKK